ncbi:glycoside hydrolase family 25 protein [Paenibacillus spongiae]|uniref:Glycoside hydrolase family 25 protein n=1 Tax=Paenibacillus spongiae TaxID=2909671 RepID=A0ABY5SHQ1_9BACL|nr:glycoside hydrolase family 25 protein [Paenibacillus spongiae]UVI32990.1 glycoside hydrolase family 25 protein [Paenibacillus spongiae]
MQTRSDENVKGIDVSHWEGDIDWSKVRSEEVQFAYIKASENTTSIDPNFSKNIEEAKKAGLLVGAYHFARPEKYSAEDEAKHFVKLLKSNPTDLMPVLDLESPKDPNKISVSDLVQWVRTFVDYVKKETGRQVMLYTGNWFIDLYQQFQYDLSDLPIWIANYGNISAPPDGGGWTQWTVWQYTENGKVDGIDDNVDLNAAVSLVALKG